ncbi:hypothetical protein BURK1_02950 [Burkholderiales bacterium]|nr:hypothetical protein BURK1_02950 [Burkholderiales bacterium]
MADTPGNERFSLKRWSNRKHAAARASAPGPAAAVPPAPEASPAAPAPAPASVSRDDAAQLPPVDSLTFDADFTPFMKPDVEPSLKRSALRKLFADPRFNVMDGLDVYIDDYSKPDPIDEETVRGLAQARYLFDPPVTRINERGEVEDVRDEPAADAPEAPGAPQDPAALADPGASHAAPAIDTAEPSPPVAPAAVSRDGETPR